MDPHNDMAAQKDSQPDADTLEERDTRNETHITIQVRNPISNLLLPQSPAIADELLTYVYPPRERFSLLKRSQRKSP